MKRLTRKFIRWSLSAVLLVFLGMGIRAALERFPWTRTATYVASVPVVVSSTPSTAVPTSTPRVEPVPPPVVPPAPEPAVAVSRGTIEQSDTFAVTLTGVSSDLVPRATWYDRAYDLLRTGERWVGLFGADAKQMPGSYTLETQVGTTTLMRTVRVTKRDFPLTVLAVTPELEAQGYTPPAIQSNVATENARLNSALIYRPESLFSRTFVNPLDRITIVGAYGNVRKSGSVELQHLGADLDASENTPVYAINDGAVNLAEEFVNYGRTVVVDHGLGIFSFYLHLNDFKVKVGDRVVRGETIALSGNTGYSIAPHLHFSVRIRNTSVDPLRFIEAANAALAL